MSVSSLEPSTILLFAWTCNNTLFVNGVSNDMVRTASVSSFSVIRCACTENYNDSINLYFRKMSYLYLNIYNSKIANTNIKKDRQFLNFDDIFIHQWNDLTWKY